MSTATDGGQTWNVILSKAKDLGPKGSTHMKTQDTDTLGDQTSFPPPAHPKGKPHRRFAGIGAVIAITLIVGLSAIVFAQLAQHHSGKQPAPPHAGQWQQVLKGYTVVSLVPARSDPSVL